jgi:quercetin dioxygenase-like cupin family protein
MKTQNIPQMTVLHTGKSSKVLEVTGSRGMCMPEHISTKEAVVIVQKGSATLKMAGKEFLLKKDDSFLIPAAEKHTLTITEDFKSCVVMSIDSEIQFINK